jgi:hypothetical protein
VSAELGAIRHPKKAAFLAAYSETGNISRAADAAEMDRQSHYNWLKDDPEYVAAFEHAKERAIETLEFEARRRALHGVERMKFDKGKAIVDPRTGQPYIEREYSDTLAIFLLKSLRPEVYRDRTETKVDGHLNVDSNVTVYTCEPPRVIGEPA